MAAAIVEAGAEGGVDVDRLAVPAAALGIIISRAPKRNIPVELVADRVAAADARTIIVVLIAGNLAVETKTVEVRVDDEVHDTRDRVSAVHRRCAAGQDFNALQHEGRDHVDVAGLAGRIRIARRDAAAVDQGQRALGAKVAKVDFRGAASRGSEDPGPGWPPPKEAG